MINHDHRTFPERGDLVFVNFDPQAGHEQAGKRPAIVISPHAFNIKTGFAVVCPITRQSKGYPFEVPLPPGLEISGVILTDQVKSIDWQARRMRFIVAASPELVQHVREMVHTYI